MRIVDSTALACQAIIVAGGRGTRAPRETSAIARYRGGLSISLLLAFFAALPSSGRAALPKRLVLALDGVAYRDVRALQAGVSYTDRKGREFHRQAFNEGYFPVSRMISTFPSASDVAWTKILGDRPLPGYQRTYFSEAANRQVPQNPITTSMEYERQMTWQVTSGFQRTIGYAVPGHAFKYEVRELLKDFLNATNQGDTYYALLRSTDDAQHLSGDILALLCTLDDSLQELRSIYREREGRELEILVVSDHGNNHAGPAKRVKVRAFLKKAGYRLTKSIRTPKDIVLPTTGIESWVEIHNSPGETEKLVSLLSHLEGVDIVTALDPEQTNRFIVVNSKGEQAAIEWNPLQNSYRYSTTVGDPLLYRPVAEALLGKNELDARGFASADAWMAETLEHRYPLACERIVHAHTRAALNPATILISLDNAYVHAGWWLKRGSDFVYFGGTHGGLDDLCSDGILLSSFAPTHDTSAGRVAPLFGGFKGLRSFRSEENGAEWVYGRDEALAAFARLPIESGSLGLDQAYLRVWSPLFAHSVDAPVEVTVIKARRSPQEHTSRANPRPASSTPGSEQQLSLNSPIPPSDLDTTERFYAFPDQLRLEPGQEYLISGRIRDRKKSNKIFAFTFRSDNRGMPVAN